MVVRNRFVVFLFTPDYHLYHTIILEDLSAIDLSALAVAEIYIVGN